MSASESERLTWDEICARYPDEWVLLTDADLDVDLNVRSAAVVFHSSDPSEATRQADAARLQDEALLYTGDDPARELVYVL